ncbi:MAG TPA: YgaP-like transmembrane domain [Cryobacterium sp.]|nr:YgaP-like transmembrane domain [Cryobacterium sp.]
MFIVKFLASTAGRWTRAIVGVVLVVLGIALGAWWWLLAALGAVFIAVGAFDVCLLAPLAGKPLQGQKLRDSF